MRKPSPSVCAHAQRCSVSLGGFEIPGGLRTRSTAVVAAAEMTPDGGNEEDDDVETSRAIFKRGWLEGAKL